MNNGRSKLIPPFSANIMALIIFIGCSVVCVTTGFWPWLALIMLGLTFVLFLIEGNSFVRKCIVQISLYYVISLLSSLLFFVLLGKIQGAAGKIFKAIDWVIRTLAAVLALISAIKAFGGKLFNAPVIGKLSAVISKKLGIF